MCVCASAPTALEQVAFLSRRHTVAATLDLPLLPACLAFRPAARRLLGNINVQYQPSGQVARKLGVSYRTLGRMTGARCAALRRAPCRSLLCPP